MEGDKKQAAGLHRACYPRMLKQMVLMVMVGFLVPVTSLAQSLIEG
jgi:hypothetical protein